MPRRRFWQRRAIAFTARALAAIAVAIAVNATARATQVVDYPQLGVRFTVPAGWTGREVEAGVVLGSHTVPGLVLLRPHEHRSLAALQAEAQAGLGDGAATTLRLHGNVEPLGAHGLGGEFRGQFDGVPATAYVVGLINPQGAGLTVLAATQPDKYTAQHKETALAVARSIEFYQPKAPSMLQEWRDALANRRLARYASSYSSGSGGYSGYQASQQFHLCAAGYFVYGARESGSFDSPGAFGSTRSAGAGHGRWQIIANNDGSPWLQLTYRNGTVENYKLERRGSSTYLNGARYFRAESEQCR
ncbi:MAG: hypothetical protein U5L03_14705 [Burkholderiaceae bacterium]|nr:hypothetical protein [Burkholderiaceae bacterium]